jgi:peptidoglycan/LPS O-acetylase OafA/YrhL
MNVHSSRILSEAGVKTDMNFSAGQYQRLKLIRCVALGLIIVTHTSQEYGSSLGQITNTGVQMFLVLSGFVLGQAATIEWKKWFGRRLTRLLPAYYIVLAITALAYWLILDINIADLQFFAHFTTLHFIFFQNYPFWGGHLWFITAIMICYAIFPALFISRKLGNYKFLSFYLAVVPLALPVLFYLIRVPYRLCGDIYSFIVGFMIARLYKQNPPINLTILFVLLSGIVMTGEFLSVHNRYWNVPDVQTAIKLLWPWKKCLYATTLCLLLYLPVFDRLAGGAGVNFIDKYSYEIYLFHKMFFLGPLSLLHVSGIPPLNISIAIVSALLCALAVHKTTLIALTTIKRLGSNAVATA